MNVGVLAIQGAVSEHIDAVKRAFAAQEIDGTIFEVRTREQLEQVHGLIIPGGESTTISKAITRMNLFGTIRECAINKKMAIMGTCAGCIILAKKGDSQTAQANQRLLGLMDMRVERNAFGRQRQSFEKEVPITGFDRPFNAVFIRAPAIAEVWGTCRALAFHEDKIVMAQQDNLLALAFHPELTKDIRIHEYFLAMTDNLAASDSSNHHKAL